MKDVFFLSNLSDNFNLDYRPNLGISVSWSIVVIRNRTDKMNSAFQLKFTRTSNDGQFSFSVLPIVHQNDALNVLTEAFYPSESVCKAIKLSENAKAVDEINELVKEVIKDGVSVMVVDNETNDIVGVSINKLWVRRFYTHEYTRSVARKKYQQLIRDHLKTNESKMENWRGKRR